MDEKKFILKKENYTSEEVADIILDVIYKIDEEKLCRRFVHIGVYYEKKRKKFSKFY